MTHTGHGQRPKPNRCYTARRKGLRLSGTPPKMVCTTPSDNRYLGRALGWTTGISTTVGCVIPLRLRVPLGKGITFIMSRPQIGRWKQPREPRPQPSTGRYTCMA